MLGILVVTIFIPRLRGDPSGHTLNFCQFVMGDLPMLRLLHADAARFVAAKAE